MRDFHLLIYENRSMDEKKFSFFADPKMEYKLVWPEGEWALPVTEKGCPVGQEFKFAVGTVFQVKKKITNTI